MTINSLQNHLIKEIEELTKNMSFVDSKGGNTELSGFPQAANFNGLPGEDLFAQESENTLIPYFVVSLDKVEYRKKEAENKNQATVIVEINVCRSDKKGFFLLVATVEKIAGRFLADPSFDSFWCERTMNTTFPKEATPSYFTGKIEMLWNLPDIETGGIL